MLSNTLSVIERIIKEKLNSDINITALLDFFKHYKYDMWVYPGTLKRKFCISISDTYKLLNELEKQGILKSYYELYCNHCQKSMGVVQVFNELPETFLCELCGLELPSLENSILIYKVIKDD